MLKRIYILFTVILVLAILVTGLLSIQVVNSLNERHNRNFLLAAAQMIRQGLDGGLDAPGASQQALAVFGEYEETIRVTIVDRQGNVLFDNEADQGQMDNHLFRPEISFAFQNKSTGTDVRTSSTLGERMLYIAIYDPQQDIAIRTAMSLSDSQAALRGILTTLVVVMASALMILLIAGIFMTRLITQPLINLQNAAQAMAEGEYSARVHNLRSGYSETALLSQTFNAMAEKLQAVVQDLGDKNARLDVIFDSMTDPLLVVTPDMAVTFMNRSAREVFGRDLDPGRAVFPLFLITHNQETDDLVSRSIKEKKSIAADCTLQTVVGKITFHIIVSPIKAPSGGAILTFHDVSEVRKVQKMRSDFVANVTHELRTPLTSIRGFIETLRAGAISNPEVAGRFLEIIDIEAERLHKLISDILILSEIEDLRQDKDVEDFNLNALIDDVAVLLDEAASARQVSIIVENDDVPLLVHANQYRIKQVLINLADNAIKYNYEGGKVYIKAERLPEGPVRLTVRDTGPGISREHQERVFERFYRIDTSRSRELGGTGLGLSIVKHIAQLYGGTARVSSQPGQGSTFIIDLGI